MARRLLLAAFMLVDAVFHYRTLIGKCELGCGLEWEEIDHVTRIEQSFAADPCDFPTGRVPLQSRRRFRRQLVELTATMRGDQINDPVDVIEMGPGGLVARRAPFIARGELVEIVIDDGDKSYRFRARGVWLRDDGDDYVVGFAFVGMPVCLNKVQISAHTFDVVDKIRAAAA